MKGHGMKVIMIVIGSLGGLYAVAAVAEFIKAVKTNNPGTAYGGTEIAASFVPVCLGLIVCLACFQRALRKPSTKLDESEARRIAERFLAENPLDHPDYELYLGKWFETPDAWFFPLCYRCTKDIPEEEWDALSGAQGLTVGKVDGAVDIVSVLEYAEMDKRRIRTEP